MNLLQTRRGRPRPEPAANRRLEVQVEHSPSGEREIVLRDLSFGPGIGWYVQKSIRLDREQADALRKAICCAREPRLEVEPGGCRDDRRPRRRATREAAVVQLQPPAPTR